MGNSSATVGKLLHSEHSAGFVSQFRASCPRFSVHETVPVPAADESSCGFREAMERPMNEGFTRFRGMVVRRQYQYFREAEEGPTPLPTR